VRGARHPVVGGNVSFYNASSGDDIDPTPVVGVLGLIDELDGPPGAPRCTPAIEVIVLGDVAPELGGSEWAAVVHRLDGGAAGADLDARAAARSSPTRRRTRDARRARCERRRPRGRTRRDGDRTASVGARRRPVVRRLHAAEACFGEPRRSWC
jgi:hypothetical protein